jgi:CheY-like chemotaxis protein
MKMACESAVDIVSDFINYEKLECDICTLEKSAINIIELVHKWVQPFRVQAKYRQIELIFIDDVQSACIAEVDEYKLSQVFRNLVSNAIKFSPAHGTVIIKMSKELNDMVRISVSDNGAGISIDNQTKLFTDIVQFNAKALQGGGGSGIGLWVSRKLMDAHGGTIGVYSAGEGLGSTFFIGLPLSHQSASVSAITKRASLQSNEPIMKNGKPLNILVVDDSVLSRKMCSKLLSKLGIHVKEAGDGTECLEEVIAATERGHCFDAILMDSSMVTMNGAEATSELRKRGYQGKIYGVTGECCESDTLAFLHAGADCIYIKPLAEDAILKILADLE